MAVTLYMVEMNYPCDTPGDRAAYDLFYERHIDMLLGIPGFLSAQRFECVHAARAPFLAVYGVRNPDVMTSDAYTSTAGRLSVPEGFRVRMTDWDRNLVQTGDEAIAAAGGLAVPLGGTLVLVDRITGGAAPLPDGFAPLRVVGLDSTIAERGWRAGAGGRVADQEGWAVREFRPIHAMRTA
mgnify:CR=1 FL=1